jgi:hypothetical protein
MTLAFIAFGVSFAGMTVAFIIAVQHRNYWRSHRRQRGLVDNATALTEPVPAVCIGGLGARTLLSRPLAFSPAFIPL